MPQFSTPQLIEPRRARWRDSQGSCVTSILHSARIRIVESVLSCTRNIYVCVYIYIYIYIESLGSKNCRVELRRNQKRTPATWFFIIIRGLQVLSLILLSDNSLFVIFVYSIGYNELSLVWPNPPSSRCRSQAPSSVTTDVYSYRRRLPHAFADPRRIKEAWA